MTTKAVFGSVWGHSRQLFFVQKVLPPGIIHAQPDLEPRSKVRLGYVTLTVMYKRRGFTLIELLVVMAIIGILASILYVNFNDAGGAGRDAKRQSDLRNLQSAIELYKQENGRYPEMGCSPGSDGLSGENDCSVYIEGLAPEFISPLPHDPKRGSNVGYAYITNDEGTVYKMMAVNTVESESVGYDHEFNSCDIKPDKLGRIQNINSKADSSTVNAAGLCTRAVVNNMSSGVATDSGLTVGEVRNCRLAADNGTGRFAQSYGVWGGFAAPLGNVNYDYIQQMRPTTAIICK